MAEKIYCNALRTFKPREGAPEFVLGALIINVDEFIQYVKEHPELLTDYNGAKQLKFNVLKSDKTGVNFQVDNFKPTKKDNSATVAANQQRAREEQSTTGANANYDLPF